jgi:cell division protein FtsB
VTGIQAPAGNARPPARLRTARGGLAWLLVLLVVGGFVAFQVGRQVYASWSIGEEAERYRAQIAAARAETEHLQAILEYLNSDAYISQQARRLLNLGDPHERVLIIPPGAAAPPPATVHRAPPARPPLFEQWLDLFFGS